MSADMQGVTVAGATFNPAAAAGYTWSLGDLASYSSRLDVDWDHSTWANGYDTEAELVTRWGAVIPLDATNPTAAINCADGGSGSSQDEAAMISIFAANCNTDPDGAGSAPNVCNNVFKIPSSCTIDVTAEDSAGNPAFRLAPALNLRYSNFAIIGASRTTSKIVANNAMVNSVDGFGPLLANDGYNEDYGGQVAAATYTWGAGSGTVIGTSQIAVTGSCAGIDVDDASDGDGLDESSILRIIGTDAGGDTIRYQTRVTVKSAASDCTLTLQDPLPSTFVSRTSIETLSIADRTSYVIFRNLTISYPHIVAGYCTSEGLAAQQGCAAILRWYGFGNLLIDGVVLGPGSRPFAMHRGHQLVVRHSTMGPNRHGQRRANNNNFLTEDGVSLISFYNNAFREGMIRISVKSSAMYAAYMGFNYTVVQTVPNGIDDATAGNYCTNATGGVYPGSGTGFGGPERSIFVRHDGENDSESAAAPSLGHYLIEASDFKCRYWDQGDFHPLRRYSTMFRNRFSGSDTDARTIQLPLGAFSNNYANWIANRAGPWSVANNTLLNGLGLYNVSTSGAMPSLTATGLTWPTSGTGRNYFDADQHDDFATTNLPPSLGLRINLPPSWWCTESGTWDGTLSFGYGDGGDNGGTPRKLPAQIRDEGGTCTAPAASVDYGTP